MDLENSGNLKKLSKLCKIVLKGYLMRRFLNVWAVYRKVWAFLFGGGKTRKVEGG
jgi:hypothetical protein